MPPAELARSKEVKDCTVSPYCNHLIEDVKRLVALRCNGHIYRLEANSRDLAQAELDRLCEQYNGWDYRAEIRRPMHHPIAGIWSAMVDRFMSADEKIQGSSTE